MTEIHRTILQSSGGPLGWALDAAAQAAYARDGVLVIEDFVTPLQCDRLRERATSLLHELAPSAPGTIFSTRDQRHARDAYFESTAASMGLFYEEEAVGPEGQLLVPLERSVNKLGHAMHDLDPVFDEFSHGVRLQAVADGVGLGACRVVQSMYIFKQPGIGGEVNCHQDATYLSTRPQTVVGFWFAIEDAHRGNGCLGGLPGEHRKGLRESFRRDPDGVLRLHRSEPAPQWDMERLQWLEVRKGTLIVFDGLFPHLSNANRSAQSRHAYTLHAVSEAAEYAADNWIQRTPVGDPAWRGFV